MENEKDKLYPNLPPINPTAPQLPMFPPNSNDYRMVEINKYLSEIQSNIEKYEKVLKKKKTAFNTLHYINTGSNGIGGILTAGSIAVLALGITGVGLPIVCVGLGAAGASLITGSVLKKLVTKIKKYEKLIQNGKSSYFTINGILSDALIDQNINPTEFKVIQKEYQNYLKNCQNIKSKHVVNLRETNLEMKLQSLENQLRKLR